ncbi:actinobacterial surface-anchored domain protein [Gleimia coleocanis DSM 15436]|uniref:Actinobacterial surface-anchored domain protein n=1 Tax=Gleimia coleocanis DSM 15436 TaxID=525245 RepID=C0W296_9ACTO|nr:choice-of-anchor M domain-containing protein [Gleimia coleocanis]EEH63201.1 actinobacterial surface-anchored domain protein [Gleimia coleocanis DSM 15436]
MSYAQGQAEFSTQTTGTYPVPQVDSTLPAFDFNDRVITDKQVTVSVAATDSHYTLNVSPAQAYLPLHVSGGFYADPADEYPTCEVNFISFPGVRSFNFSTDDCYDITTLKLKVVPDSRSPYGGAELTVNTPATGESATHPLQLTDTPFVSGATNSDDAEEETPTVPADPQTPGSTDGSAETDTPEVTPSEPAVLKLIQDKVTISDGHLDIGPHFSGDKLVIAVKDDSRQHATSTVLRDPAAVSIAVPDAAQVKRSSRIFGDKSFDFLGEESTPLFVLGATQQAGRAWPGFSTEDFDYQRFPAGVDLELSALETPAGANWWGFTSAPLGGLGEVVFDSQKPLVLKNPQRTHMHLHWAFTTPGTYRLQVRAVVPESQPVGFFRSVAHSLGLSAPLVSEPATLTFVVGKPGEVSTDQVTPLIPQVGSDSASGDAAESADSLVGNTVPEGGSVTSPTPERNTPGLVSEQPQSPAERNTPPSLPNTGVSGLAWMIFVAGSLFLLGALLLPGGSLRFLRAGSKTTQK